MERLFHQKEWQNIAFSGLPVVPSIAIAGRDFYSAFYQTMLAAGVVLEPAWVEQKLRVSAWLAGLFTQSPRNRPLRILSVGAGLGIIEADLSARGFVVDAIECEEPSLRYLRAQSPHVQTLVSDARGLPFRGGIYDWVYLCAADYCFDKLEYQRVLSEMRRVAKPSGQIVSICVSNLSVVGMLKATLRSALKLFTGRDRRNVAVPWGYRRTVREHLNAGRKARLSCTGVYVFDPEFKLRAVRSLASSWHSRATVREGMVAIVLQVVERA